MLITSEVYERKDNFSSAWVGFKALNEFELPDGIRYVIVGRQFSSYNWGSRMAYDLIAEGNVADQLNGIAALLNYQVLPSGSDYILSPLGTPGTITGWYYDSVSDVTYYNGEEITSAVQIAQLNYSGLIEQWLDVPPQGTSTRQVARAYFDTPSTGQGTVTLSIKKPGQTLNFVSRLLSKTVSQYISEDAVVDMNNSPLYIFKDGKFYNTIAGFDITQYIECGTNSYDSYSQYFGTAYGLSRASNTTSGKFEIDENGYLSRSPVISNNADRNYIIPIQTASGYTKVVFEFKFTSLSYRADGVICGAWSIVNGQLVYLGEFSPPYNTYRPTEFEEFEFDLSTDLSNTVDYIAIGGDLGAVSYKSIKLVKS